MKEKELIYTSIYKKLIKLVPHVFKLKVGTGQTSKSSGYMDLYLDILEKKDEYIVIALSHTYEMNGDRVPDPDMEIKIYPFGMAEALAYQDFFGYRRVYPEEGKVNLSAKRDLNDFLKQWLTNCLNQGHKFNEK